MLKAGNTAYDGLFNNAAFPNPPVSPVHIASDSVESQRR